MNEQELRGIARALLLAGGAVAVVLGGLGLLSAALRTPGVGAVRPVFGIAVGIVALATLEQTKSEVVMLVLIVLGLISGNAGGFLIALAGILALVAKYTTPAVLQPVPQGPVTST
jgi:hypothetical protein